MKLLSTLVLLLLITASIKAQTTNWEYMFPEKLEYKSAIITTFKDETFETKMLTIVPEEKNITYMQKNLKKSIALESLNSIQVEKGNHAFIYGLIGLGAGLAVFQGIFSANNWDDPFNDVSSSRISSTFFVCVGIPLAISIPIGIGKKKYKRIYTNGQFINKF